MAKVLPFRATRYQDAISLAHVTAPPYDVLQSSTIETLRARSPYNAVYLSKNPHKKQQQPYAHIPGILQAWHQQGTLTKDIDPCYYYAQDTFIFEGVETTRSGFFALIEVQQGNSKIIPHEHTIMAHIQDRLKLMDQTNAHLSPIFLIADDKDSILHTTIKHATPTQTQTFKRFDTGYTQTFGIIKDPDAQCQIETYFDQHDLLIADGHHRFKTALAYSKAHKTPSYVLAFITSSVDPGLALSSIHRAIRHTQSPQQWVKSRLALFDQAPLSKEGFRKSNAPYALLDYENKLMYLYKTAAPKTPTVSFQENIIEKQMNIDLRTESGQSKIKFFKQDQSLQKHCQDENFLAFWLQPMDIQSVFDICQRGEVLPQKSTYFFPKVLDGLVYYEPQI